MSTINTLIGITVVTFFILLLNGLLLFLTYRMRRYTKDVNYIIGLAISDSTPFAIAIAFFIALASYKNDPDGLKRFRQGLGFLEMFWPVLSAQFTASLAVYRVSFIHEKFYSKYWILLPIFSSVIIFIFLVIVAVNQELILSPSAFISQPYPHNSIVSAFVFYHIFIHVLICNIVTIVCYMQVVYQMSKVRRLIKLENNSLSEHHHLHSQQRQQMKQKQIRNATLKGIVLITLSAFILIPGICIYFIEGYIVSSETISLKTKAILATVKPVLFLVSGIVNSLFVLFFHTGINKELKKLFSCNKRRLKDNNLLVN